MPVQGVTYFAEQHKGNFKRPKWKKKPLHIRPLAQDGILKIENPHVHQTPRVVGGGIAKQNIQEMGAQQPVVL